MADTLDAVVVDGGTDSGVMQMMRRARAEGRYRFPLIGVAVESLVTWPSRFSLRRRAPLEPHHTHFVLVPGSDWGDDSTWLSELATTLSASLPSVTVLINGGEIAWEDVSQSIKQGRSVIVVAGTGRTADRIASALRGGDSDARANGLIASGRLQAVDLADGPGTLSSALQRILSAKE